MSASPRRGMNLVALVGGRAHRVTTFVASSRVAGRTG